MAIPTQILAASTFKPSAHFGAYWVELVSGHTVRDLRSKFLDMVYFLQQAAAGAVTSERGVCVLVDSKISVPRIQEELLLLEGVLHPDLAGRLIVGVYDTDSSGFSCTDKELTQSPEFKKWLQKEIRKPVPRANDAHGRAQDAVLEALMNRWFLGEDTVTAKSLQDQVQVSYPTVTTTMERLESLSLMQRTKDRKFQLRRFPSAEFDRWLLQRKIARPTLKFERLGLDRGRTIPEMVERLARLNLPNVAISGTVGANVHYPEIDLVGHPRLDLVLSGVQGQVDLGFLHQLDAGLEPVADNSKFGVVALHFLGTRPQPWQAQEGVLRYADPLQCMVDLHELGFDGQMREMLADLLAKADARRTSQSGDFSG